MPDIDKCLAAFFFPPYTRSFLREEREKGARRQRGQAKKKKGGEGDDEVKGGESALFSPVVGL